MIIRNQGRWIRCLGVAMMTALLSAPVMAQEEDLEPVKVGKPVRIEVFPPSFKLIGQREQIQMVVTGHYANGTLQDLTRVAKYSSSNKGVAFVKGSVAFPKSNGSAEITVSAGGKTAKMKLMVSTKKQPVSFNYDTLAAFSKNGCNSGACHGSPSGKGGFRLSLRAFDSKLDKLTLIREEFGRRVNPLSPDRSLVLLKPLMKVPHGGGKKMNKSDPAYKVIRDWISEGCKVDPADAPTPVAIQVYPPSGRVLKRPAHTQQLCVLAKFSDGSIRDITPLAVYTSSDEEVASPTVGGLVIGQNRGEAAIVVRYLSFIESTFLTFVKDIKGFVWSNPKENNYIDLLVHKKLKQLKFLPSDVCTDEEFIRRVYLDVIGLLPSVKEVKAFMADKSANKRAQLIDTLLDRPEFAKFWALKWGDLLRLTNGQVGGDGVHKYYRWIERAFAKNMPYDQFARELLTAVGSTYQNPAANFYRTSKDTNDCVETVSQIFLGARLQCAKCHNHPFERWTQDNYYGMAAFFNRLQRKTGGRPNEMFVYMTKSGDVTQPRTGQKMKPWLPLQGDVEKPNDFDRRITFVDWLTKPNNPFFAKIEANRIWYHLLGRGIVDPPDDFRDSNPPSNAALLDALAKDFVKNKYDRKHVIRTILNSRAYQASFRPNKFNKDDTKYFSHYQPRLLSAEQLLDAICHVTSVQENFSSLPPGTKATQLPAPDLVKNDFLKIFGQPERQTVCQCERSTESNLGMAIQFFNGPLIYNKLRDSNNRFRKLIVAKQNDESIIRELHLAAVNRLPTKKELTASMNHIRTKRTEIDPTNKQIAKKLVDLKQQLAGVEDEVRAKLVVPKLKNVPKLLQKDLQAAFAVPAAKRSEVQKYLVKKLGPLVAISAAELKKAMAGKAVKAKIAALQKQLKDTEGSKLTPAKSRIMALEDICWALLNTNEFLFQH